MGSFSGAMYDLPGSNWIYLAVNYTESVSGTTNTVTFNVKEYTNYGMSGTWNTRLTVDGTVIWNGNCTWDYATANAGDGHPAGSGTATFTYNGTKTISVLAEITNMDYTDIHGGGSATSTIQAGSNITLTSTNQPPNKPTITATNPFDSNVVVSVTGTDPENDSLVYNLFGWLLDSSGNKVHWDNQSDVNNCIAWLVTQNSWTLDTSYLGAGQRLQFYATTRDSNGSFSPYSDTITVTKVTNHPPTAPSNIVLTGAGSSHDYATDTVSLTWTAGTDVDGDTVGYDIYYTSNYTGKTSWNKIESNRTGTTYSFSMHDNGIGEGYYVKFQICSSDGKATSGFATSDVIYHNRIPAAITGLTPTSGSVVYPNIPFSWNAVSHADSGQTISYHFDYRVYTNSSWGGWNSWGTTTSTSAALDITNATTYPWGCGIQVRCFTQDGFESSSEVDSAIFYKDTPPPAPTISYPVDGSSVYDTNPRVAVTINSEANSGQTQELHVTWNGVTYNTTTAGHASYFSRTGTFANGTKVVFTPPTAVTANSSSYTITCYTDDGMVNSLTSDSNTVKVVPLSTYSITNGTTTALATMITDLRTQINTARAAYGLTAYSFTALSAGDIITKAIFTELQTAIGDITDTINNYDSGGVNKVTQSFTAITAGSTFVVGGFLTELYNAIKSV